MTERRPWTLEEDKILKHLRQQEKVKKWSQIARIMESTYQIIGRNQKQCRQRYQNHLNSEIVTQKLSEQEEKLLFRLHDEHGNKWSVISNNFPGRTDNSLKNHFHSKLRGAIRKINRYLGCKKKRGTKIYPLSIVYNIVKYFGQNNRKDGFFEDQIRMMKGLKNGLLRFGGANVDWQDGDWDEKNEKKMAERIIGMLQRFEKISGPNSNKRISEIEQEMILERKDSKLIKTQEAIPQNSDRNDFQLFRTFSENSMLQKMSSLKECQQKIQNPIIIRKHSITKSFSRAQSNEEPELQFQKLQILKKKPSEQISQVDSDIRKLVQEKCISTNGNRLRMQKMTSFGSYSMEMVEESELRRNDSISSKISNIWSKELDFQNKFDSCIFQ